MNKKIIFGIIVCLILISMLVTNCSPPTPAADGYITVSISGLDNLNGFTLNTSDLMCAAYDSGLNVVSGSAITDLNTPAPVFTIGVPDYLFAGGQYFILLAVDIDSNGSFNDAGTDYATTLIQVNVNGDQTVILDQTDFSLQ
jgi:hypothetical protein